MNYAEVCIDLEEKYQKIRFLRSTGNYDEAANNIRKILEMICEYYGDLYHISVFRTEKYNLYDKIKYLQKNNRIDKESREAFVTLKHLGNTGSHYNRGEAVNQNQLDKALPILRSEIDKFIEKNRPNNSASGKNVLFAFESLSEEGWCGNQNIKTEFQIHQSEGDMVSYYVEDIIYILPNRAAPRFLYEYALKNQLPLIAWDLDKRIIKQDRNEYFCHANIPIYDLDGDILNIEGHIVKENTTNEIIVYDIRCKEQIFYHYEKYARQLNGIWCEKKTDIEHFIKMLNWGNGLSELQEDNLMFAFHFGLPKFAVYKVRDLYCIDDDCHNIAMILSRFGDIVYEREKISTDIKIIAGDLLRVHCLENCIKKYLKPDEELDDWRNISTISLRDGLYTIPFLYDYLWGFKRDGRQATYCLIDTYSDEVYPFDVKGNGAFLPNVNELLSNAPIEIDFRALLEKMQQVGSYGLTENLIDNISYEAIIDIYKSILHDEKEKIEAQRRLMAEEEQRKEKEKQEYEERQRLIKEQEIKKKEEEEKKRKEKAKKRNKKIGIGVTITLLVVGFMAAIIILPIVGIIIYNITPKYININDYVSVEVEGYERIGEVKVVLDYEQLEEDYGDKIEYNDGYYSTTGKTDFDAFFTYCKYSVAGNGELSNGDRVLIEWSINNDQMFEYFNYGIKFENIEYTVEGLQTIDFFNAFDSLTYSIDGVSLDATISMQNTINIDGYPGLLFTCDKTEGIANNDIITISLVTENGDDLYDYCANRFNAVPEQRELEIVVSGLPEYITSYEQISDKELQTIIDQGARHLCDYYNQRDYGYTCKASYVGNYFLVANSEDCNVNNSICVVYHIERTIYYESPSLHRSAIGTYEFYAIYGLSNISITSEGKFLVNYDDWYYPDSNRVDSGKFYYEGCEFLNLYIDTTVYGYETTSQIYPDYLQPLEESYIIQNNMQDVIDSN